MKKKLALILTMLLLVASISACSSKKDEAQVLNIYNWGEYIDEDLLTKFEEETGIKVNYDMFVANEDMYVKLKNSDINYDLVIPSDYMIQRMIKEDMVQKLDFNNIPNYKNIDEDFKNKAFDPTNEYSVPYFWGTLGMVYDSEKTGGPVDSWDALWDEKYKGEVIMMDSSRDSIGVALVKLGYSLNSKDPKELEEAKQLLIKQRPLVSAYLMDETKDIMKNGEATFAVMYSGDAVDVVNESPNMKYVVPKEGSNVFIDAMVVLKNAQHKENAEKFINFMLDPENAAQNAKIGYSSPISAAVEKLPSELKDNKAGYPDKASLKNLETFEDPGDAVEIYDQIWQDVKNSN